MLKNVHLGLATAGKGILADEEAVIRPQIPLQPVEIMARNHALLCTIGFLILLPVGILVARYARTFTNKWWFSHAAIQLVISGPVILAGWVRGYDTAITLGFPHFKDPHQKMGLALLVMYLVQIFLGGFVHFAKIPFLMTFGEGRRPLQNYIHALLGLAIMALAASQVHYGLYTEWTFATGSLHPIPTSAKQAWMALIIIFWVLYVMGLALLPRQFRQEKRLATARRKDEVPLNSRESGE